MGVNGEKVTLTWASVLSICCALLAIACGLAIASPIDQVWEAYGRGDYETALNIVRPLVERGDPKAQSTLGTMFLTGHGVPRNYSAAVKLFRKSADQGYAPAQFALGGRYTDGLGVQRDSSQAVVWYRKAAEQGFAPAQFSLGVIYAEGIGVPQNYVSAYVWLNLAAAGGHPKALEKRDLVSSKMSPAQIAQAQKLSREWTPNGVK